MATNPELLLISAMLNTKKYKEVLSHGVTTSLFHDYEEEWKFITKYIAKHRRVPSKKAFRAKFENTKIADVDDVEHFIDEVKDAHTQHELINVAAEIADGVRAGEDPNELLKHLHAEVIAVQSQILGESEVYEISKSFNETYVQVRDRAARVQDLGSAGVPTGYGTIDEVTGGIFPGHYWIIAARLGQGKSWTMMRMAVEALLNGYTVQYYSLEASRHQVAMRVHTLLSSVIGDQTFKNMDLTKGENFRVTEYKEWGKALGGELDGKFYINDQSRGAVTPLTIAANIERSQPDIVFIDYLTLLESDHGGKLDDWQSVGKVSEALQKMAQRYETPIIAASQINRSGEGGGNHPPGTENLSRSDAIGQDADAVITLKQITKHTGRMRLAKYRHGRDGQVFWVSFKPNTGELEEISGDEAMRLRDLDLEEDEDE